MRCWGDTPQVQTHRVRVRVGLGGGAAAGACVAGGRGSHAAAVPCVAGGTRRRCRQSPCLDCLNTSQQQNSCTPAAYRLNFSMNQSGTDSTALLRVSCSGRRAGSVDHARAHGGGGQQSGRTHVRATVQVPPLTIMKPLLNCKTLLKSLFHCKECVCATQGGGGCGACPAEPRGPTAAPAQPLRGGAGEALPLPVTLGYRVRIKVHCTS